MTIQITTKYQKQWQHIQVEYQYGSIASYTLPDKMTFTIETGKFKMPKVMAIDINSKKKETKSEKPRETGIIKLTFSNYLLNQGIEEKVFNEN